MWIVVGVTAPLALLVFVLWRIADHFPPRYRRHSLGEIQQTVDHVHGIFDGLFRSHG
jgi:hypothetical protein